jgi:ABC-type transport system involved in cytochrome c biogenesis ATPase subunit
MDVKLTRREPYASVVRSAVQQTETTQRDKEIAAEAVSELSADLTIGVTVASDMVRDWRNMHDADPEEATRALVELVRLVRRQDQERDDYGPTIAAQRRRRALDRLLVTPEGAALLEQEETTDER